MNSLAYAYLDNYRLINLSLSKNFHNGICECFYLIDNEKMSELKIINKNESNDFIDYTLSFDFELNIGANYKVSMIDNYTVDLEYRFIVKTDRFNKEFYYEGNDLGANIIENRTIFKLWAPTASFVYCLINDEFYKMNRVNNGVFELEINKNLVGVKYQYLINVNGETHLCNDPYAKAVLANNQASVVSNNIKEKITSNNINANDAIIYEVSVRDNSKDGTFNSFDVDYIKTLGVTHIQLLPVNDFGTVNEYHKEIYYNWGYDPINYQALEGSYSSDVTNPLLVIDEFKSLINKIHNNKMNVILDVVFNHIYNYETSSFNKIVPYYYFRYKNNQIIDGTGCGCELDSKQLMMRKFIVDTLKYYVEYFNVDGFRFDLMSFIDVETMNLIHTELIKIKNNIMLYGEGWDMNTGLDDYDCAKSKNSIKTPCIGYFNDQFRNVFIGSMFDTNDHGLVNGNLSLTEKACELLLLDSFQNLNYVQCHDNMTAFDRLSMNDDNYFSLISKMKIINAFVLTTYSIPFIGAGQEFAISKDRIDNNYDTSDLINKLCNRNMNQDVLEFTRRFIEFRKKTKFYTYKPNVLRSESGIIILKINKYKFIFNCSNEDFYYENNDRLIIYSNNDLSNRNCLKPYSMFVLEEL